MRNSKSIQCASEEWKFLRNFDLQEIDNEIPCHFSRLRYLDRIDRIIKLVERYCEGSRVLEIGSAQANISLLLAERGFSSLAFDLVFEFLTYSRCKYECGDTGWICGNAMNLPFRDGSFDAVVLSELIEHVAFPRTLVNEASRVLKNRGVLIISTPNANCVNNKMVRFSEIEELENLKNKQFGPAGEDHLFAMSLKEVILLVPKDLEILESGFLSPIVLCSHSYHFYRRFPLRMVTFLQKIVCGTPILRSKICSDLFVCVRRSINTQESNFHRKLRESIA